MSESLREEITRLEALYAGNPGGRVFTHLAEAYRKAGELDRAREILDGGLRHHAGYASAYVVLGRVLMDMGQTDEARAAFRRVIELDRHNLVALRSLADLAIVAGDTQEALRHYRELLTLDPDDDRLQGTIARLESDKPPAGTGAPSTAEAEPMQPEAEAAGGAGRVDDAAGAPDDDSGVDNDDSVVEDDGVTGPGEMMTETMAELYTAQGLHVRAAEVYRSLLRTRPGDDRLEEKLRRTETLIDEADADPDAVSPASAPTSASADEETESPSDDASGWLERVESAWTGGSGVAGGGPTPYAWTEMAPAVRAADDRGDPPISAYFESLLAWRPGERVPSQQAADGVGAGETRGTDANADRKANEPTTWLDDDDKDDGADRLQRDAEPVENAGTVEDDEDLEMFRSWLQSLKK